MRVRRSTPLQPNGGSSLHTVFVRLCEHYQAIVRTHASSDLRGKCNPDLPTSQPYQAGTNMHAVHMRLPRTHRQTPILLLHLLRCDGSHPSGTLTMIHGVTVIQQGENSEYLTRPGENSAIKTPHHQATHHCAGRSLLGGRSMDPSPCNTPLPPNLDPANHTGISTPHIQTAGSAPIGPPSALSRHSSTFLNGANGSFRVFGSRSSASRLAATPLPVQGNCSHPPAQADKPRILDPPRKHGQCVITVREDFLEAPLEGSSLWLAGLYLTLPPVRVDRNHSTLINVVGADVYLTEMTFVADGQRSRAIDVGGDRRVYIAGAPPPPLCSPSLVHPPPVRHGCAACCPWIRSNIDWPALIRPPPRPCRLALLQL